jgi:predicted dehydrogenase
VVRIGVVGAGLVATTVHLPLLRALDDRFEVVALADPDPARRDRAARRFGVPRGHAHHRDLIDAGGLDALLVCSPSDAHAETVLDALTAGLHVLVEKPLCLTLEEADAILAARGALTVQVGYMKRFDPAYEALLDELPEVVHHISTATYDPGLAARFGFPPVPVRDAYADAFLGALVHDVNAVHGVLERLGTAPWRVIDGGCTADGRVATGTVALPGGARWTMAWMLLPGVGDFREEIALYADDGVRALSFPAPYLLGAPTVYTRAVAGARRAWGTWEEAYARQLEHFHRCVTEGEPCRTPPEQARADIDLLARIYTLAMGTASGKDGALPRIEARP